MDFTALYGGDYDEYARAARYDALAKKFETYEHASPEFFFSSSGRAEILGNHTDHQHGKVVVAAISCDVLAAVKKEEKPVVRICSEGYKDIAVSLSDLAVNENEYGTSQALTRGVLARLKEMGKRIGGFTAHATSSVFKGAGVSSSAAFELLVCEIENALYLSGSLSKEEKAAVAQYAENAYFNKPCGILDQMGISLGGLSALDFRVPERPLIQKLQAPAGYSFIITNTGGSHARLTGHYADIKKEMLAVSNYFGKEFLRDVDEKAFYAAMPDLLEKLPGRSILRAKHIFDENRVVDRAAEALKTGDVSAFLDCIRLSGESSLTQLQNNAVPGEKAQRIPVALKLSERFLGDRCACRVHGGGFAGTILAVVENGFAEDYTAYMKTLYGNENVFLAKVRSEGACRVL